MNSQPTADHPASAPDVGQAAAESRRALVHKRLWRAAAGVCLMAIGATAALPIVALSAARAEAAKNSLPSVSSPGQTELPDPALPTSLGIRTLPLLSDTVEAKVSPDRISVDPANLRSVGTELASSLGLEWDSLINLQSKDANYAPDYDKNTGRLHPVEVAQYVSALGAGDKLKSNPQAVIDLSSLVMLSGAIYAGGIAEGLLMFGEDSPTTCDRALNLAFVVLLSHTKNVPSDLGSYSRESRARLYLDDLPAACPDDPTALWLIAVSQGREEITSCTTQMADPALDVSEYALNAARELQRHSPTLAAGFAAEAEILMAKAELEGYVGVRPFSARELWTSAEALLAHALTLSSNSELVLARGEALTGMGRVDGADLIRGLGAQATATSGRRIVAAWVLAAAGDYSDARNAIGDLTETDTHFSGASPTRGLSLDQDITLIGGAGGVAGNMSTTATHINDAVTDQGGCGGGSSTFDGGFVPVSRTETFGPSGRGFIVPDFQFTMSLQWLSGDAAKVRTSCESLGEEVVANIPACRAVGLFNTSPQDAMDAAQDLYRAAGQYSKAVEVLHGWLGASPEDPRALELLGEVQLLTGNPEAASESLTDAVKFAHDCCNRFALLKLGYAYHLLGRDDDALKQYRAIPDLYMRGEVNVRIAYGIYYYRSLLEGASLSEEGDWSGALVAFRAAADLAQKYGDVGDYTAFGTMARVAKGVAEQNGALAATRLKDFDTAVPLAQQALAFDPRNPLFIETLAEAERGQVVTAGSTEFDVGSQTTGSQTTGSQTTGSQTTGSQTTGSQTTGTQTTGTQTTGTQTTGTQTTGTQTTSTQTTNSQASKLDDLTASYRKALDVDPTLFSSWNNLGVLLAAGGHHGEATDAFRNAVAVRPDYAIGWFNLGSELLVHGSWTQVLAAEGALGYADRFDSALRSETPALAFDDEIYKSGLDLSRLLPPDWQLASSARRSTTPLTLALIVLLLGRVVTALSHDTLSGWIGEKAMSLVARIPSGFLRWLNWPAWLGVVLSVITFVLAGGLSGPREALIAGPCLIAIAVLPSVLRRAMGAVPNEGVIERTPALGVGVSAVLAVAGVAWPPVPTMSASVDHSIVLRARRVVIVAVAGVALVLVVSNILGAVPVSRAVMSVAIASMGSLLVPVKPSDGAFLGKKSGLVATIALAGLTALQALGLA